MIQDSALRGKIVRARDVTSAKRYHLNDSRGYVIVDVLVADPDTLHRATYYRVVNDLKEVQDLHHSLFVRENN